MEGTAWRDAGLTLVELMVALALSLVLMVAVYLLYLSQSSSSNTQSQVSHMQQDLRLVMDVMEKDIRMAGLDPERKNSFGIITAGAHNLVISLDRNGDGSRDNDADLTDVEGGETISYGLSGTDLTRQDGAATASVADARSVIVNLTVRSVKPEPETGLYLERKLERRIRCRNLGL